MTKNLRLTNWVHPDGAERTVPAITAVLKCELPTLIEHNKNIYASDDFKSGWDPAALTTSEAVIAGLASLDPRGGRYGQTDVEKRLDPRHRRPRGPGCLAEKSCRGGGDS